MTCVLLILRPGPDVGVPAEMRLRRTLKFAKRGCRLDCVHLEEIVDGDVAGVIGAVKSVKRRIPVG